MITIEKTKYYLELRIKKFIDPNELEAYIRKPLSDVIGKFGNVTLAIPEYQTYQSHEGDLPELKLETKVLFFKYVKVSIVLYNLPNGIESINNFLKERGLTVKSQLLFTDERYDLLDIDF